MQSTRLYLAITAATSVMLALPTAPVFAAAATLEQVIVTARKREENVQETPLSITAVLGEDLEKRGVSEFAQLSYNNPNVKILPGATGAGISTTVAIRGNVQNDVTAQIDPAVGTYIDGFIIARTFGVTGSMMDVESVQTLKGPQGTLFGRNTTGGALLIATRNPDMSEAKGFITGEMGEIGTKSFVGAINIPITDSLALRIAGQHAERGDYMELADGREFGHTKTDAIRAKLLWNITDATSVLLSAERADVGGTAAMNVAVQPNDPQYHNVPVGGVYPLRNPATGALIANFPTPLIESDEKNSVDAETYSATVTHELEWGEVKFLAGQRMTDIKINQSLPPGTGYTRQDKPDNEQTSVEVQVNGSFMDDRIDLTSGVYWFDEQTHEDQLTRPYTSLIPAFGGLTILNRGLMETNMQSTSLYAQSTYHLTDATGITLGLRYTDDQRDSKGTFRNVATGAEPFLTYEADEQKINYLVSIDHAFTPDLMMYANTSTGYRSGGANISKKTGVDEWNEFSPESLTNYEIGLKSDWLDGRLRINAAIFHQDYEDYQYTQIVQGPAGVVRQATTSNSKISGGELETTILLPADITLALSYGYVDGEADGGPNPTFQIPNIPRNTAGATVSKSFELAIGTLDLTANYDWRDKFYTAVGFVEQSTVENRGLLNLSASLASGPWQVVAYVNNATDEAYYQHLTYGTPGVAIQGVSFASLGLPRVAGAKLTFNF